MTQNKFNGDPILFTLAPDVRSLVKDAFTAGGAPKLLSPSGAEDCLNLLENSSTAILILDWGLGSEVVNRILCSTKQAMSLNTREILLIVPSQDHNAVMTGLEFGVTRIMTGEISKSTVSESVQAIVKEHMTVSASKAKLLEVFDLRKNDDWTSATKLLSNLNIESPGDDLIAFEYAENLIHQGDWSEALNLIHPLAESDTPNVRSLHLYARCLMSRGDYETAISILKRANICNPHNVDRLIDLGNSYLAVNKFEDATKVFGAAVSIDPSSDAALKGQGQSLLMNGDLDEALPLLKSISSSQELAGVFNTSAILCAQRGQFAQSLSLYRMGLAVLADEEKLAARMIFNMGIAYKKQNEIQRAFFCFDKAFQLDTTFIRAEQHKSHLAKSMKQQGVEIAHSPPVKEADRTNDNPFDMPDLPAADNNAEIGNIGSVSSSEFENDLKSAFSDL